MYLNDSKYNSMSRNAFGVDDSKVPALSPSKCGATSNLTQRQVLPSRSPKSAQYLHLSHIGKPRTQNDPAGTNTKPGIVIKHQPHNNSDRLDPDPSASADPPCRASRGATHPVGRRCRRQRRHGQEELQSMLHIPPAARRRRILGLGRLIFFIVVG